MRKEWNNRTYCFGNRTNFCNNTFKYFNKKMHVQAQHALNQIRQEQAEIVKDHPINLDRTPVLLVLDHLLRKIVSFNARIQEILRAVDSIRIIIAMMIFTTCIAKGDRVIKLFYISAVYNISIYI